MEKKQYLSTLEKELRHLQTDSNFSELIQLAFEHPLDGAIVSHTGTTTLCQICRALAEGEPNLGPADPPPPGNVPQPAVIDNQALAASL
jgi:hypothetical protein